MSNRAARRRAEKVRKKGAKLTPKEVDRIVSPYWDDVWRFTDAGLNIHDRFTRKLKKHVTV